MKVFATRKMTGSVLFPFLLEHNIANIRVFANQGSGEHQLSPIAETSANANEAYIVQPDMKYQAGPRHLCFENSIDSLCAKPY